MKKHTSYFLIASLVINLILGAFIVSLLNNNDFAAEAFSEIEEAGTYGPKTVEVIKGNLTIKSADVVLQNTHITGNLYLTEEIGDGSINFLNVTVDGTTYVNGGGENSVYFENSSLNALIVNKEKGTVRVVVRGKTNVKSTKIEGSTKLATESLKEGASGFGPVAVSTTKKVDLFGQFVSLLLEKEVHINLVQGSIGNFHIATAGAKSKINLSANTTVETFVIDGQADVTGEGNIAAITINASGLTKLAGAIKSITTKGKGIYFEITKGSVESLTVEENESATSVHLAEESSVKSMILLGKAGVTGTGKIEAVEIKSAGTTIAQTPVKVVLAKNITANVGGQEISNQEAAQPNSSPTQPTQPKQPTKPSQPGTSTLSLGTISDLTIGLGQTGTRSISVTAGSNVTVASSNNNVSASISGNTIILVGNNPGSAQITVKAEKAGSQSATRTFTVTVDIIKSFEVKDGLTPGNKLVIVELYGSNSGSHSVTVGGKSLNYMPSVNRFSGEVSEGLASRSNVVVR